MEGCTCTDYSESLADLIAVQREELEELRTQTEIMREELNGFTYIVEGQRNLLGFLMIVVVVVLLWNIIAKWFFGGV